MRVQCVWASAESSFWCVQEYGFGQNSADFILTAIRIEGNFLNLIPIMVRIPLKMKRKKWFYILSFCRSFQPRSWPSRFLRRIFSFLAAHTSAVWSWPALPKLYQIGRSFSFPIRGSPMTLQKNKRRITIIRPITENVPCGRSNRNPSNIINVLAFLNVRTQCNIRGAESQCSAGDETQSLQCVHF